MTANIQDPVIALFSALLILGGIVLYLVAYIVKHGIPKTKCKYYRICGDPTSITCTEEAGMYYEEGRPCGRYGRPD